MIQNILTFCVKNDLTFVEGSIPSGKLVANDINRNSIYLITPYDESIVKANFQTNLQSDTPTSVLGILVNGKISVDEIVDTTASYYNLVKDWNIYEFKVPSTTLSFISRNRTGKIGINFSIEQRLVPTIKDSYGEYQGEILSQAQSLTESGYYINKTIEFELDTGEDVFIYNLNDILVLTKRESPLEDIQVKIRAYSNRGSTPTTLYSVDPSLLNDNFETITPGLTQQIVQQVNDHTGDIVLLFQNIGVNNATLVDLENRVSVAEQDIDTAENDIDNLQGRMATAESDIDNIEDGTTIVEKALKDDLGNTIKSTYANKLDLVYSSSNNRIAITLKSADGTTIDADLITLPKATTSADGLLAKEDKVKINNIATDIASAISTHDGSQTSHLYIRTLIANLQKEVDRINAKGRSWGEVDKTFSELWAMAEPTRSDYINTFLATAFSGYTPSNGDLVYTIVSDGEEEHELEYNSTLSQWVDNGAYIVSKASNTQHGIVKGDLDYVSILNGIIQVLKSDYATNVGSSGASYDYDDLLALFTEVANDIYKKNETYSATQIEQRLTDLLGMANLQDVLIGSYTDGQTVLASDLSAYNFVVALGNDDGSLYTEIFKPSEIVNDNVISLSPVVYLTRGATDFTITTPTSVKLWGIKLDWINKTYAEIIALRTDNKLMPGQQYRITDYTCTTIQSNTKSAGHAFDLIVVADSVNKLNEQARAIQHDGDTYFANSKLEAWQVWYSLDNDTNRFAWADSVNGKGVIYRMIDEFNNDVPYDFKNIQFIRKITDGELDLVDGVDTWVYTFNAYNMDDSNILDGSLLNGLYQIDDADLLCKNNTIKSYNQEEQYNASLRKQELNDIVFLNTYSFDDGRYFENYSNTLGNSCYSNTFGNTCSTNTFGNSCYSNTFGNTCSTNTFGNSCRSNTFGNDYNNNTFGNDCSSNTFGNSCYNNTFGNSCYSNTFGNDYNNNTFGNDCYYNKITGDSVKYISVDNGIKGASSANQLELYDSAIANKTYQITYKKDADGRILMLWADDIGDTNGLYKTSNLDDTWKTIPQEIEGGTF